MKAKDKRIQTETASDTSLSTMKTNLYHCLRPQLDQVLLLHERILEILIQKLIKPVSSHEQKLKKKKLVDFC